MRKRTKKGTKKGTKQRTPFDPCVFLSTVGLARSVVEYRAHSRIFSQGDPSDAVFYIQKGSVKLSVVSRQGKEAVVAVMEAGEFLGEACLAGQILRVASAIAIEPTTVLTVEKDEMLRVLKAERTLSGLFIGYLLKRKIRIEEDLVDHLFNSAEKRLARALLLLAHYGSDGKPATIVPEMDQGTLAEMIGVTRERVNVLMNRFRKMGFVDYNGGLVIHNSLLNIILHD